MSRTELRVRENPALTAVTGFNSLSQADGGVLSVEFYANQELVTISAFGEMLDVQYARVAENPNLSSISIDLGFVTKELRLLNNDALVTLQGIGVRETVSMFITGNDELTDAKLPNLTWATSVTIEDNAQLTSLIGLFRDNPVDDGIGEDLVISGNPMLTLLGDFPYAELDELSIRNNASLADLTGFPPNLTAARLLIIQGNETLESLTTIKPTISTLSIFDNTKLPTCLAETYRDLAPAVSGSTTISGNDDGASCTP